MNFLGVWGCFCFVKIFGILGEFEGFLEFLAEFWKNLRDFLGFLAEILEFGIKNCGILVKFRIWWEIAKPLQRIKFSVNFVIHILPRFVIAVIMRDFMSLSLS